MHRDGGDRHRYRLSTFTKVGENRVAGDGHAAGVGTLPRSVLVVYERVGRYGTNLERRTDKFSCVDFLGQADKRIHQEALSLALA